MDVRQVLAELGAEPCVEAVSQAWNDSMAAYPADGLPFLADEQVAVNWEWSGFAEPLADSVTQAARTIRGDPALSRLAWHCYWRVYLGPEMPRPMRNFPSLERALGAHAGEFYLLLAMAMVPLVRQRHRAIGLAERVTRDTCLQVRCHCGNYTRGHDGRLGVCRQQLHWHRHYVRSLLFRLGRLEFMSYKAPSHLRVYRHRDTRQVVALIADGTKLTEDGYVAREPDMPHAWTAALDNNADEVVGYPVSPRGHVVRRQTRLPRGQWDCVLAEGAPVLQLHIPAGGHMEPEACRASFQQAPAFFARYFPEHRPAAILCDSWILNPRLQDILPPDANLVRFQRELYLYPLATGPTNGLWFLFFQDPFDAATAPRQTSVQRAILDFLAAGRPWHGGGMFFLADDVGRFGTKPYLCGTDRFPPAASFAGRQA